MTISLVTLLVVPKQTKRCIFFIPKARGLLQEWCGSYTHGSKSTGMSRSALWTWDCNRHISRKRKGKVFEFSSQPLKYWKTMLILYYTNMLGAWKKLSLRTATQTSGPGLEKVPVCVCQKVVQSHFFSVLWASVVPVTEWFCGFF